MKTRIPVRKYLPKGCDEIEEMYFYPYREGYAYNMRRLNDGSFWHPPDVKAILNHPSNKRRTVTFNKRKGDRLVVRYVGYGEVTL